LDLPALSDGYTGLVCCHNFSTRCLTGLTSTRLDLVH